MQKLKNIYFIIGNPIKHSLSPLMYNNAFKFLGIEKNNIFLAKQVKLNELESFINFVRENKIKGISCTIPLKTEVMKYLDVIDENAKQIGAVNTIVNKNNKLIGFNTDIIGFFNPFKNMVNLKNKKVAVLGAGGAARAIIFGLLNNKSKVTIFNRTVSRAKKLSSEFGCDFLSLSNINEIVNFDIIINSTSVGMNNNQTLIPKKLFSNKHIVFDIVYTPLETKLICDAKEMGAKTICGFDMLLQQAFTQFKIFTGINPPKAIMRYSLLNYLSIK